MSDYDLIREAREALAVMIAPWDENAACEACAYEDGFCDEHLEALHESLKAGRAALARLEAEHTALSEPGGGLGKVSPPGSLSALEAAHTGQGTATAEAGGDRSAGASGEGRCMGPAAPGRFVWGTQSEFVYWWRLLRYHWQRSRGMNSTQPGSPWQEARDTRNAAAGRAALYLEFLLSLPGFSATADDQELADRYVRFARAELSVMRAAHREMLTAHQEGVTP